MRKNQNTAKNEKTIEVLHETRGIARQVHFEMGGTVAMWRGIHTVTKNGKAHAQRNACRGRQHAE